MKHILNGIIILGILIVLAGVALWIIMYLNAEGMEKLGAMAIGLGTCGAGVLVITIAGIIKSILAKDSKER